MNFSDGILDPVIAKRTPAKASDTDKIPPATELRATLAANIRSRRRTAGLTQKQLGDLANVSRDYVRQIEGAVANVSIDVINVLARHLNTTPAALLIEPAKNP